MDTKVNVKKAVLAVSFGTSYAETREKTIDKIEQEMREAYPQFPVYRAWTSRKILRKLMTRDEIHFDYVCEAMERMAKDGIREVIVQPTHVMNGIENDGMVEDVLKYADRFDKIVFGKPLLTSIQDSIDVVEAVMEEFGKLPEKEALVFMGHGTPHHANAVYAALDYIFKNHDYDHVFVGTVEGYPELLDVMKMVKKGNFRKVHLAPLMLVAGDHAVNDMSGEEKSSWKNCFEAEGYEVECHLKGLGEYSGIRRIFLRHLSEAVEKSERLEAEHKKICL